MAMLIQDNRTQLIQTGGPLDFCYACAKELKSASKDEFFKKFAALKGKLEGQVVLKIQKHGENICICKKHIAEINSMINGTVSEKLESANEEVSKFIDEPSKEEVQDKELEEDPNKKNKKNKK